MNTFVTNPWNYEYEKNIKTKNTLFAVKHKYFNGFKKSLGNIYKTYINIES